MGLIKAKEVTPDQVEIVVLDADDPRGSAELMLDRARDQADRLLDAARNESERIRCEAFRQAREEALEEARNALVPLRDSLTELFREGSLDRRRVQCEAERSMLALAVALAEKVVRRVPEYDPTVVGEQIRCAIQQVLQPCDCTLRVHSADRWYVEQILPELCDELNRPGVVNMTEDDSVGRGGCAIVFGRGRIDVSIHSQLARLVERLLPVDERQQEAHSA